MLRAQASGGGGRMVVPSTCWKADGPATTLVITSVVRATTSSAPLASSSVAVAVDTALPTTRAGTPPPFPPLLWSFWDMPGTMPPAVLATLDTWRLHNPDYTLRVLTLETASEWAGTDVLAMPYDTPTRCSDMVRLLVLARWGGFWLDASILLTAPLEWMQAAAAAQAAKSGVPCQAGFFWLRKFTSVPVWPVIESWAFACVPGAPFVCAWRDEFLSAFGGVGRTPTEIVATRRRRAAAGLAPTDGFTEAEQVFRHRVRTCVAAWVDASRRAGVHTQRIDNLTYLCIHVAAQRVMQKRKLGGRDDPSLVWWEAEATAYAYLVAARWQPHVAVHALVDEIRAAMAERGGKRTKGVRPRPAWMTPLLKLRGCERPHMNAALAAEPTLDVCALRPAAP